MINEKKRKLSVLDRRLGKKIGVVKEKSLHFVIIFNCQYLYCVGVNIRWTEGLL